MSHSKWTRNANGRTVRRRNRHGPKFVRLFHWMMKTPAWQSLSGWAIAAYLDLARHYNGINNGDLHLSAREFAEERCSRQTASRAIAELIEKGFIEVTRNSGFNVKSHQRQARTFRLTVFFCDLTKSPASRAFENWTPKPSSKKHSSASQMGHLGLTGETEVPPSYRKH